MHLYPKRASLEGLEIEIFKLVSYSATPEQWQEWLRVPLEHAVARGNLDLFNKLLGAGANGGADWKGCRDRSLLDAAAVGGNEDVLSGLLRVGAQPDVEVVSCSSKRSALYAATVLGHEAVARHLVIAGADVNFQDPLRQSSVLNEAIRGGHVKLAADLLVGGANPNCPDGGYGASSLYIAATEGYDGVVSALLLRGADKDAIDYEYGETPLMGAFNGTTSGHISVVKILLAAGVDVSIRDGHGQSALVFAAREGEADVVKAIVRQGADVNARHASGFTALHTAAFYDQASAVVALIEAGANLELETDDWFTPLAVAAFDSNSKAMLALLQHGAKVDVRDTGGGTPLHEACRGSRRGLEASVDLLLRWGADEGALNDAAKSPIEVLDLDNEECISIIATQDELEQTRLLLSRAPAGRAWRRRGWLVMLRSRAEKARIASSCGGGSRITRYDPGVADGLRDGKGCKMARKEETGGGAYSTDVGASRGGDSEGGILTRVVMLLVGMEPEGVFRTIMSFL